MALIVLSSLLARISSAGCHTGITSSTVPTLSLFTHDVSYGSTDDWVFARILSGSSKASAVWSDWRNINNAGCDDRERDNWDNYDDFSALTDKWYAVALYNCGNDGHALSGIRWWDGDSYEDNVILYFCGNVAGPSRACYKGANYTDSCDANYGDPFYDYVWLDQNNAQCNGVSIATGATLASSGKQVAQVWWKSDPGIPSCGSNEIGAHSVNDRNLKSPQDTDVTMYMMMSEMNVVIVAVALLVVANVIGVTVLVYRCVSKRNRPRYTKVDMESS